MRFSLCHLFYVIELDKQIDTKLIDSTCSPLLDHFSSATASTGFDQEWLVTFDLIYSSVDANIRLFTASKTEVDAKRKRVTINIPIPQQDQVAWGVKQAQVVHFDYSHISTRYMKTLPYTDLTATDLQSHVSAAVKVGLISTLQIGFKLNGVTIKLP